MKHLSKAQKAVVAAPNLSPSPENDAKLAKILWLLAEEFAFSTDELSTLLDVKPRTVQDCRAKKTLPLSSSDRYRRVGLLLGIKKNLEILFPRNPEVRENWLRVPREAFGQRSAMDLVLADPVNSMGLLFSVRRLLDLQCNGAVHAVI